MLQLLQQLLLLILVRLQLELQLLLLLQHQQLLLLLEPVQYGGPRGRGELLLLLLQNRVLLAQLPQPARVLLLLLQVCISSLLRLFQSCFGLLCCYQHP